MTRRRVLIVNTHPGDAEDLGGRLATLGYEVAGNATSGEEAIDLAGSAVPDLGRRLSRSTGPQSRKSRTCSSDNAGHR